MSPTSTSEEPRRAGWRGLPLGGFAADVGIFVLMSLAFAFVAMSASMAWPTAPAAQHVSAVIERDECGTRGYDEAALLALLHERGEPRPIRQEGKDLPLLLPAVMRDPAGPDKTAKPTDRQVVTVGLEMHPRQGRAIELGPTDIEVASGCAISDFLMFPLPQPGMDATGLTGRQLLAIGIIGSLGASLALWAMRGRKLQPLAATMALPRAIAWGLAGGLSLQGLAWVLSRALELAGLPLDPSNRSPLQSMLAAAPWMAGMFIVLIGPFAEELAFRHVMLRRFANAGRPLAGLLLTSVLFAAAHEIGPGGQSLLAWLATTAVYACIGLGFGGLYLRTGRLATSVTAHVAMNAAGVALLAYSVP